MPLLPSRLLRTAMCKLRCGDRRETLWSVFLGVFLANRGQIRGQTHFVDVTEMVVVTGLAYELLEGRVGGATRCVQRLPVRLAPIATASSRMSCAMAI